MDSALTFRLCAAVFVLAVLGLALFQARPGRQAPGDVSPPAPAAALSDDPLRARQRRCQALGAAGAQDAECLATWAESRRRFIGEKTLSEER
jgi:conjugative transfer region protein TrbK